MMRSLVTKGMVMVLALSWLVAACQGPTPWQAGVALAPEVTLYLPAPVVFDRSLDVAQQTLIVRGEHRYVMEGRLSVTPQEMVLVVLDPMGGRALTLLWTGDNLAEHRAHWLPDGLQGNDIIAQLLLIFAPEQALAQGIRGAELRTSPLHRALFQEGQEIISIDYPDNMWNGVVHLHNQAMQYDLTIHSVEIAP
ncbi:MAG: DUF3261 domain-containing protein [Magnetococcales bacterium]|nr:DUF3261 domain-containing protein [Magnetococcales bacterium]